MKKNLLCLLFLLYAIASNAQLPYRIDSTFTENGIYMLEKNPDYAPGKDYPVYKLEEIAIAKDDKIVFSGNAAHADYVISRVLQNGEIDSTFNKTGHVVLGSQGLNESRMMNKLKLLQDGSIIYSGDAMRSSFEQDIIIMKFKTDGMRDLQFGTYGIARIVGPNMYNWMSSIDVRLDNCILVAGASHELSIIAKLLPNGTLDNSFGQNGSIINPFNSKWLNQFEIVKNLDNNKFLAVGKFYKDFRYANVNDIDFISRFHENGTIDSSFGIDGKLELPFTNSKKRFNNIEVDINGNIYLSGYNFSTVQLQIIIYKFTNNGILDTNFGQAGGLIVVDTPYVGFVYKPNPYNGYTFKTTIQEGTKLMVCGTIDSGLKSKHVIMRLNPDGMLDTTFQSTGYYIGERHLKDEIRAIDFQSSGKIILGGYGTRSANSDSLSPFVIRLTNDSIVSNPLPTTIQNNDKLNVEIYPNPTKDKLHIRNLPKYSIINIQTIEGKVVLNKVSYNKVELLNLKDLAKGIYIISIIDKENRRYSEKIILE